ncbi:MAG: hypothetical protein ACJ79A_21330 [Gemmatimonadaceae bacterium]
MPIATTGTLAVVVVTTASGRQAEGIAATVEGRTLTIQGDDAVRFDSLSPGNHTVRIGPTAAHCFAAAETVGALVHVGATDTAVVKLYCIGGMAFHEQVGNQDYQVSYLDETGRKVRLTRDPGINFVEEWSPDGSRLLLGRWLGDSKQLYSVRADGTDFKQLTSGPYFHTRPRWSPDGRRIAFYRWAGQSTGFTKSMSVIVMDADGANKRVLLDATHVDFDPVWSTDGSELYFTCNRFDPNWNLCAITPEGTGLRRIRYAAVEALDVAPPCTADICVRIGSGAQHWEMSPDGSSISFMTIFSPSDGPQAMWVGALDGSSATVLTPGTPSFDLDWAPDGRRALISIADEKGGFALLTAKRDGSEPKQFSDYANRDESGRWSPDGALIAFDAFRSGRQEVWVANPDGTGARPFLSGLAPTFRPFWNPRLRSNVALPLSLGASAARFAPERSLAREAASAGAAPLQRGECLVTPQGIAARVDCMP